MVSTLLRTISFVPGGLGVFEAASVLTLKRGGSGSRGARGDTPFPLLHLLATHGAWAALYTFSFLTLLYFAAFSIVSARERRWFWTAMPSKAVAIAAVAEVLAGTILTHVGIPGLMPLPWSQTLMIFAYAMVSCLVVNDAVKVAMIKWTARRPSV